MKYNYTPIVKNQKDNPFWKLNTRDKVSLQKELLDRLLWLNQLGSSKQDLDVKFYHTMVNVKSREFFGSAPNYGNQANTGVAALAGAIDKLTRGDLSQKQFSHMDPLLKAMHNQYPRQWSSIEFEEVTEITVTTPLERLFEIVNGE
tara:strand:- start:3690 stop:4127 length:438 start_codon:yes stop_codon:yes gene_type:complete